MGWSIVHKGKYQKVKEYMAGLLTSESSEFITKPIDSAFLVAKREYYAAIEQVNKNTGKRVVWCSVYFLCFYPKSHLDFGYKDVSEIDGFNCPERILNLLTPDDDLRVTKHRLERLEKHKERKSRVKLSIGNTYRFKEPVQFNDGSFLDMFVITNIKGSGARLNHRYKISISCLKDLNPTLVIVDKLMAVDTSSMVPKGSYSDGAFSRWLDKTQEFIQKEPGDSYRYGIFDSHPVLELSFNSGNKPCVHIPGSCSFYRKLCPSYEYGDTSFKDVSGLIEVALKGVIFHEAIVHEDDSRTPPYYESIIWVSGIVHVEKIEPFKLGKSVILSDQLLMEAFS